MNQNQNQRKQLKEASRLLSRASSLIDGVRRMDETEDMLWDLDYLVRAIDDCIYTIKMLSHY